MTIENSLKKLYSKELFTLLKEIGNIAKKQNLNVYAVGGFVRDLLLKKPNFDIDIMVEGNAILFAAEIAKELKVESKAIERFGTAHLRFRELDIDFSSARKEVYKHPGELPEVSFSNLRDDLSRRDFSINAMALYISGNAGIQLIDLFDSAIDLKNQKIRVLHNKSFIDDPTRLYRAIRFAERFGFSLDENTECLFEEAINGNLPEVLSLKRIAAEINKCFLEKHPLTLIAKYQSLGLLKFYHKSFTTDKKLNLSFSRVRAVTTRLARYFSNISENAVYWALFLSEVPINESKDLLNNSGLPHPVVSVVSSALGSYKGALEKLLKANDNISIFNSLSGLNSETIGLLFLTAKDKTVENKMNFFLEKLSNIKTEITGKDLIKAGIKPGPKIKEILNKIIEKKVSGVLLTRKEELDLAIAISNI